MVAEEPNHKSPGKQSRREHRWRRLLSTAVFELLWWGMTVRLLWSDSHIAVLWLGVAGLAVAIHRHVRSLWTVFISIALLVSLAMLIRPYLPLNEQRVWLTPGTKPSPPSRCPLLTDGLEVYFGAAAVCEATESDGEFPIIRGRGKNRLSFIRATKGLTLSARIFAEDGIVAEIDKGEFKVNPDNLFKIKRPDLHTLVVYDKWGTPVIGVEFLNPDAVLVTGSMFDDSFRYLTEDMLALSTSRHGRSNRRSCLVGRTACIVASP